MRIAIGSDHAGFALKEVVKRHLVSQGHEVEDVGTHSEERCDYPIFAASVATAVDAGKAERGVLVCGSGIGMCMAANRFPQVRAAVLHDEYDAMMARGHNDANVACMGARKTAPVMATRLLDLFLTTPFEGGRHQERVALLEKVRPC